MENNIDSTEDLGAMLVGYYDEYEDNTWQSRAISEKVRDFYDNIQWTAEEIQALEDRGQPVVTFNMLKRTVDALKGLESENKTDPKALPRTPKHEEEAESATDSLRYIADNNDFNEQCTDGFANILLEGVEGFDVTVMEEGNGVEVKILQVEWDRMFWDVHSRKRDFSDAKYKGIVIWMDYDDARQHKDWDQAILETSISRGENPYNDAHEDQPAYKWNDQKRKRVKVCYINYLHKGVWHYAFFTKGGVLKGGEPSPFVDEYKRPQPSLEFQSAYVKRDGTRYGYAEALLSPQEEINKRRSKSLHAINQRQTFGNQRANLEASVVKAEMAKPDGHVDIQAGEFGKDFGVIQTTDMTMGNLQLLQEAKEVFNVVGANTSVTGKEDRVMSGRAEIVRQQAGARELAPVMDAHSAIKKRVYRKCWNRAQQYWTGERWIRVTDDEENLKFVQINRPITLGEQIQSQYGPLPQQFQADPRLGQVVGVENQLAELDVDITIEESPDIANIQQEQFEIVAQLAQAYPEDVRFEDVVMLSSMRNKKEFMDKRKNAQDQETMQRQQNQQEMMQIQKAGAMTEIQLKQSTAEKNKAAAFKTITDARNSQADVFKTVAETNKTRAETAQTLQEMRGPDGIVRLAYNPQTGVLENAGSR